MVSISELGIGRKFIVWMTMALTVSLLVLGIFNALAIRQLDVSYSVLISKDLATIGTLRDISRQSAETHRCLLNLVMNVDAAEITRQTQKLQVARAANDHNIGKLATSLVGETARPQLDALIQARKDYVRAAEALIGMIETGSADSIEAYRIKTVRPAYDTYLQVQDALANTLHIQAEARSRDISDQSKRLQYYSLGLSTWPLLMVVLAVLVVVLISLVLFWLGWRIPDEPV